MVDLTVDPEDVYPNAYSLSPGASRDMFGVQHIPKHDTVKLTEYTYLLLKHQVALIINGYGLLRIISTGSVAPDEFITNASGQLAENPVDSASPDWTYNWDVNLEHYISLRCSTEGVLGEGIYVNLVLHSREGNAAETDSCGTQDANTGSSQGHLSRGQSNSYRGRGRGSNNNRPQCQLCGRFGYVVQKCYHHFDINYTGVSGSESLTENGSKSTVYFPFPYAPGYYSFPGFSPGFASNASYDSHGTSPSFLTPSSASYVSTVPKNSGSSSAASPDYLWYPDTSATHHVTNDMFVFKSGTHYTGGNSLLMGNGDGIPITHFTRDNGVFMEFHPSECLVKDTQTQVILLRGRLTDDGLYQLLPCEDHRSPCLVNNVSKSPLSLKLWHQRLGHPSLDIVQHILKSCSLVFNKTEATDGGGEYQPLRKWFCANGVQHRPSCPGTSEQNGKAERKHRHIVETGLTMLARAFLPQKFWSYVFVSAVYLINRLPTPVLHGKSPFEALHRVFPDYSFLRVFGCACYPCLRLFNHHKLDFRSKKCVFLGYSTTHKGYKCLDDSGRVIISKHVVFDESTFPYEVCNISGVAPDNGVSTGIIPLVSHVQTVHAPPNSTRASPPAHAPHAPALSSPAPLTNAQFSITNIPIVSPVQTMTGPSTRAPTNAPFSIGDIPIATMHVPSHAPTNAPSTSCPTISTSTMRATHASTMRTNNPCTAGHTPSPLNSTDALLNGNNPCDAPSIHVDNALGPMRDAPSMHSLDSLIASGPRVAPLSPMQAPLGENTSHAIDSTHGAPLSTHGTTLLNYDNAHAPKAPPTPRDFQIHENGGQIVVPTRDSLAPETDEQILPARGIMEPMLASLNFVCNEAHDAPSNSSRTPAHGAMADHNNALGATPFGAMADRDNVHRAISTGNNACGAILVQNSHPMVTRAKDGIRKPRQKFDALIANNTWSLVPLPKDRVPVNCKWIFKVKHNADGSVSRYKACLVAKGFLQRPGIDFHEVFSLVVKPVTLLGSVLRAFENTWSLKDDIILTGSDASEVQCVIEKLKSRFSLKDLGSLNFFLASSRMSLTGFADANWGSDPDDRRSMTAEAEYRSAASAAANIVWIELLLQELCVVPHGKATLWCDNSSTVAVNEVPAYEQVADVLTKSLSSSSFLKHRQKLLATQVHPDKNPNDPHAAERFQVLGEAYQVLSDPVQRDAYNRNGKYSISTDTMLDPTAVFALLFGSELFEDYIGHVAVASMASSELPNEADNPEKQNDKFSMIHGSSFVVNHECRLFKRKGRKKSEARRLSDTAFVVDILHTIGYVYSKQVAQELAKKAIYLGVPFLAEWVRHKGHFCAFQLLQLQEDMLGKFKMDGSGPENDVESHLSLNKETLMNSLWKLNVVDIEVTLVHVCQMFSQSVYKCCGKIMSRRNSKLRPLALKILRKEQEARNGGTSRRKKVAEIDDDDDRSSSESSSEDKSPRAGIGRLFRCLCNPAFDVDDDEIVFKSK
ncbi:putative DEAD-box ATP-dependent RNA helicase 29-like [Hibiscus syriacus]|uniref:DEAD-box ATP-dependent RNA helicase 29-like n=1 Tax=Hibiscus syriacus TaxID=106335 RepID=A0A6A3A0R2_HIBSY|nr:putative DEAD-box ATP-dependent RNA helicase 29-like [Hibiscus syriacus]